MTKRMRNVRTGNFAVYDAELVETGRWELVEEAPKEEAPIKFEIPKFTAVPEKRRKKTAIDTDTDRGNTCLQATSSPEQEQSSATPTEPAGQTQSFLDGLTMDSEPLPSSDQTPLLQTPQSL